MPLLPEQIRSLPVVVKPVNMMTSAAKALGRPHHRSCNFCQFRYVSVGLDLSGFLHCQYAMCCCPTVEADSLLLIHLQYMDGQQADQSMELAWCGIIVVPLSCQWKDSHRTVFGRTFIRPYIGPRKFWHGLLETLHHQLYYCTMYNCP